MSGPDDDGDSRRQVARRARRDAGVDSARLAHALMKLPASALGKLGLDEDLRVDVVRARAITAQIARRRAERSLAGALRRVDLEALEARLESVRATGLGDPRRLHQGERWRTRLLDEEGGLAAFVATYAAVVIDAEALARQIAAARNERTTGKPPGAGRALFRQIAAVLDSAEAAEASAGEDGEAEADADAEPGAE